jgi:hypothetical protein
MPNDNKRAEASNNLMQNVFVFIEFQGLFKNYSGLQDKASFRNPGTSRLKWIGY